MHSFTIVCVCSLNNKWIALKRYIFICSDVYSNTPFSIYHSMCSPFPSTQPRSLRICYFRHCSRRHRHCRRRCCLQMYQLIFIIFIVMFFFLLLLHIDKLICGIIINVSFGIRECVYVWTSVKNFEYLVCLFCKFTSYSQRIFIRNAVINVYRPIANHIAYILHFRCRYEGMKGATMTILSSLNGYCFHCTWYWSVLGL